MRRLATLAAAAALLAGCGDSGNGNGGGEPPRATTAPSGVALREIGTFEAPLFVASPPDDNTRVFVVEKGGTIRIVGRDEPFLDISDKVSSSSEQGLLGLAFPPDYGASGLFYVYYTDQDGANTLAEYKRADEDTADPDSERVLISQEDSEPNHNGGMITFGPDDLLYVGMGDGGGGGDQHGERGNGQALDTLLGKILRIDPAPNGSNPYTIPSDNPFVDREGARGEIYSYGLRNPWRFSFDRQTGDLTIGDVGQNAVEEIDWVAAGEGAGANFGWRVFEGSDRYTEGEEAEGAIEPVIDESHADGNCSITGGYVIRDPALRSWSGDYVYGDLCRGTLRRAELPDGEPQDTGLEVEQLSSFGEDSQGRVYAISLNGPVYRLEER
ncbi:PQQ-dependent sugar dehydrogenase [Solirubrobacter phytolaccae]|uniref:PQQ-dependent sugar dehydrogenase n=1 Tax=Solirubrobacter phytolaccae TaxID=1404360 RepID=A0A9X3NCM7_9ACTN|nr:PQQ-dependent sugar dehydrogenase [Solirubrobacter phytolaccae]MDA0183601.1 PQQ-dependent sugar dehydrogenase [Solirubrobacter phytolaccae]